MNNRSKTGFDILKVALGVGVLGDVLLRQTPWGLNVFLFNLAFVAGTILVLMRGKREYLTPQTWALLAAQLFFAAMFVLRDSIQLRVADSVAIVAVMLVLFVPRLKVWPRVAGVFQYGIGFLLSSLNAFFGTGALLAVDIEWKTTNRSKWARNAIASVRGLLIAAPLILVFGALFMAADAAYQGMVNRIFNVDLSVAFTHALLFSIFAWASAGYLRGLMFFGEPKIAAEPSPVTDKPAESTGTSKVDDLKNDSGEHPVSLENNASILEHINRSDPPQAETRPLGSVSHPRAETRPSGSVPQHGTRSTRPHWSWSSFDNSVFPHVFTLGTVEIAVVLGLLNLLFLSFVVVQVPYLFGGMELVQNTPDFKLAEYARRGFGELVAVSALVLPVLLLSHWLVRKDGPFTEKLFRVLAGVQLVLLFVVMGSAVQRLVLLTGPLGYGLTTVRLYPMIFMTWLAVVFVWFTLTVLRGSRQYFAWGALWAAIFVLGGTHFLNPDAFIVRTNLALMRQGRDFDTSYTYDLSADAIPAIVAGLPEMRLEDQCQTKVSLHIRYRALGETNDIRSLNWSRKMAWYELNRNDATIHSVEGCPDWVRENLELNREESK